MKKQKENRGTEDLKNLQKIFDKMTLSEYDLLFKESEKVKEEIDKKYDGRIG